MKASTLRPGYLVSLKTSLVGNVTYNRQDIEPDQMTAEGTKRARWETERTIQDPAEHEEAVKVRSRISSLVRGVCAKSSFGLLCPLSAADKLEAAMTEARRLQDEFNAVARQTEIRVYVMLGRVEQSDVEAVRAINSEVRDLMTDMESAVQRFDVEKIRDAASRAKQLGSMLSDDASARIQTAIDSARSTARAIVKAGEAAALEVDHITLEQIRSARTAFLDLDDGRDVQAPAVTGRAMDLDIAPADYSDAVGRVPQFELE